MRCSSSTERRRSRATCPARRARPIDVPLEAGEAVGTGVHRFSTLRRTRELVDLELAPHRRARDPDRRRLRRRGRRRSATRRGGIPASPSCGSTRTPTCTPRSPRRPARSAAWRCARSSATARTASSWRRRSVAADRLVARRRPRVRARRGGRGRPSSASRTLDAGDLSRPRRARGRGRGDRRDGRLHPRRPGRARPRRDERGDAHPCPSASRSPISLAAIARVRAAVPLVGLEHHRASRRRRPRPRSTTSARSCGSSERSREPDPHSPDGVARRGRARRRARRRDRPVHPRFLLDSPISRAGYVYGTAVGWIWGSLWSTGRVETARGAVGLPRDAALGVPRAAASCVGRLLPHRRRRRQRPRARATRPCTRGSGGATASSCRCCTCSPGAIRCATDSRSRPGSRTATTCRARGDAAVT